jgi:hypothetical protein
MEWSLYEHPRRPPEEALFRRVPEGWVFTTQGLWPVGGGSTYLVNDAQKAELLARLERWSYGLMHPFPFIALILLLQLTHYDWIRALSGLVGIRSDILDVTIVGLLFVLFVLIPPAIQLYVVRPILADAVALPIRVGFCGGLLAWPRSLAQTYSYLGLTVIFLYFPVGTITVWYGAFTSNDRDVSLLDFLAVNLTFIVPTLLFVVALFLKLRARRSAE